MRDPVVISAIVGAIGLAVTAAVTGWWAYRNTQKQQQAAAATAQQQAAAAESAAKSTAAASVEVKRTERDTANDAHTWEAFQAIREELRCCNAELLEANRRYFQVENMLQLSEARRVQVELDYERVTQQLAKAMGELQQLRNG